MADELAGLSESERTEIASLESEMGDSRGRQSPDWRNSYWNNADKQSRYLSLVEKADRGSRSTRVSASVEKRVESLIQSKGYWQDAAKQDEVRRLLGGETVARADVSTNRRSLTPEHDVAVAEVASNLSVEPAAATRCVHAITAIRGASDALGDLEASFDGLSDVAKWYSYRILASPKERTRAIADLQAYGEWDELKHWLDNLSDGEHEAVRHALGLS